MTQIMNATEMTDGPPATCAQSRQSQRTESRARAVQ